MPVKARPAVPYINWTGFYLGPHIGAGFAYTDWYAFDGATATSGNALIGGGQVGFNYQIGTWVFGVEGDASYGNLTDWSVCSDGVSVCSIRQRWLATATGRIGVTYDPALFYLKAGAAFTRTEYAKELALIETATATRTGWTVGGGMEFAFSARWSGKMEYDYLNLGTYTVAMRDAGTGAFVENIAFQHKAHLVKFGLNYRLNADPWPEVTPKKTSAKEPEPKRLGLAAPLDSPPFVSGDWPLGGSQLIGVPDTAVGPLMKWIYDGPYGQAWRDSRIKLYGWAEFGANASTSNQSNLPAGYAIRPNRGELNQFVFRIERLPDTAQKTHVDWGFNVTNIYGLDYRFTTMKGIFSDQLLKRNRAYGYDIPTFYGELYVPWVAEGMNIRVGRYFSIPDIEAQMSPSTPLYSRSLLYIYDPFTQFGALSTIKLNDQWIVQAGVHAGNDVAFWEKSDAKLTGVACVR